jgi:hypothetical protein
MYQYAFSEAPGRDRAWCVARVVLDRRTRSRHKKGGDGSTAGILPAERTATVFALPAAGRGTCLAGLRPNPRGGRWPRAPFGEPESLPQKILDVFHDLYPFNILSEPGGQRPPNLRNGCWRIDRRAMCVGAHGHRATRNWTYPPFSVAARAVIPRAGWP